MRPRIMMSLIIGLTCVASQHVHADGGECPIQAAMNKLPRLEYLVGAEKTCCSETAAKLSKAAGVPIQFVVGKQTHENKAAAMLAVAEQTEAFVKIFATPTRCEATKSVAIGGEKLECSKRAAATAKLIQDAMKTVAVSYKVGDKQCDCPREAKALSEKSDANVVFVVDGQETNCPIEKRVTAARAKYRAAVEALAKANS